VNLHDVVLPVHVVDGLCLLVKSPLGMFSMSWSPSSQIDPMVSVHSNDSLHWHSRSDVEWSIDMETLVLIDSLGSNITSIFNIGNIPFLVSLSIVVGNSNWLSFNISSFIRDFNNLVVLDVNKLVTSELEDLPPS